MDMERINKIQSLDNKTRAEFESITDNECKIQDRMLEIECKAEIPEEYRDEYNDLQKKLECLGFQVDKLLN